MRYLLSLAAMLAVPAVSACHRVPPRYYVTDIRAGVTGSIEVTKCPLDNEGTAGATTAESCKTETIMIEPAPGAAATSAPSPMPAPSPSPPQ